MIDIQRRLVNQDCEAEVQASRHDSLGWYDSTSPRVGPANYSVPAEYQCPAYLACPQNLGPGRDWFYCTRFKDHSGVHISAANAEFTPGPHLIARWTEDEGYP